MSLEQKLEEKIQSTQSSMQELAIRLERLDREYQQFLKEWELTPDELKSYVQTSDNFSPAAWETLQVETKKLEETLKLELTRVRDPLKLKQTFSEQGMVRPHWLFVR